MKISEIVTKKHGTCKNELDGVSYSWIKSSNKDGGHLCLSFRFGPDLLDQARYRTGDRCEVDIDGDLIIFILGNEGQKLTGQTSSKTICYSHANAEADLSQFFPLVRKLEQLIIKKVSTGRIECTFSQQQAKGTK